jgi:tetratricopeptide (TPR) repeat protein
MLALTGAAQTRAGTSPATRLDTSPVFRRCALMRVAPNDTLLTQMAATKRYAMVLVALLGSMAIPVLAQAQTPRASSAKIQFDKGQTFFDMGQYERAIHEFEIGYRLQPLPLFLFDIANVARVAGLNDKAIEYFRKYLQATQGADEADAPERGEARRRLAELKSQPGGHGGKPNAAKRADVHRLVDEMDAALDAPEKTAAPAPATTTEPAPAAAAPVLVAAPAPVSEKPATPVYKKWWLWTIVGVVAVGAGVGLGVGLTASKPYTYPNLKTSLGSFRF